MQKTDLTRILYIRRCHMFYFVVACGNGICTHIKKSVGSMNDYTLF